ncbi:MAG: SCO family protein [Pseudomonadota bacterium]
MAKRLCKKCILLSFVAIVAGATGFWASTKLSPSPQSLEELQSTLKSATVLPQGFRQLPEFSLIDHTGAEVNRNQFDDQWSMVFVGYTFCPDVCPITMAILEQTRNKLLEQGLETIPQLVFLSVDPERDSSARIGEYINYFGGNIVGLTGNQGDIDKVVRSIGAVYIHAPDKAENPNYLVDHSSGVFLVGPDTSLRAVLSAPHVADVLAQDFTLIVENS